MNEAVPRMIVIQNWFFCACSRTKQNFTECCSIGPTSNKQRFFLCVNIREATESALNYAKNTLLIT